MLRGKVAALMRAIALVLLLFAAPPAQADPLRYICEGAFILRAYENGLTYTTKFSAFSIPPGLFESAPPKSVTDIKWIPGDGISEPMIGPDINKIFMRVGGKVMACDLVKVLPAGATVEVAAAAVENSQAALFDESIRQPVAAIFSQQDQRLRDLLGQDVQSNLCYPAALAQSLAYLRFNRATPFPNLRLGDHLLSTSQVDASALVRALTEKCKTDPIRGTDVRYSQSCPIKILEESGYKAEKVRVVYSIPKPELFPFPSQLIPRTPTVDDIRTYLQAGYALIALTKGASADGRLRGHAFAITGYDYQKKWGSQRIDLQAANPASPAAELGKLNLDSLILQQPEDGPLKGRLIINGPGFTSLGITDWLVGLVAILPN